MSIKFIKKAGLIWLGLMILVSVLVTAYKPAPPSAATMPPAKTVQSAKATHSDRRSASPAAQASDTDLADAKDAVAALINLNGHLCAEPVDVRPLKVRSSAFEVTCIEYRGGSGRVRYVVDSASGTAWPA